MAGIMNKARFERLAAVTKSPRAKRLAELWLKVSEGTASAEERAEFDQLTKRARLLDPNVLVD